LILVKAQSGTVTFTERQQPAQAARLRVSAEGRDVERPRSAEEIMIGRSRKAPAAPKKPQLLQRDKKHLDELLDEALEETFPASDPPAMLEPVPGKPPADEDG
jgi:hypothetical protein